MAGDGRSAPTTHGRRAPRQQLKRGNAMRVRLSFTIGLVAAVALSGLQPSRAAADPIGPADIRRWTDAWNSHDIDKVAALFSSDVTIYQPENPKPLGSAGLRGFFSMIFTAYPDFHIVVQDALIHGSKAATFEQVTGTWSGPFTDPATSSSA
jgi:hypothetical protein